MLKNNKIVKAPEDISVDDKMEISEILKYFETKHSLEEIKYIPKDFKTLDIEYNIWFSIYGEGYI